MAASASKLVIVESPTKAKTIRKYLGKEFRVEASMGHVRDLPSSAAEIPAKYKKESWARLGVNVESGFEPLYIVPKDKKKIVAELKKALKDADELYLATDEDREGESIGWHLVQVLKPKIPTKRMVFHEITPDAIRGALEKTREIDVALVSAQETRRVLDRLVGYSVSPLLWKKVKPKLSAGRVQSVAVRILVLRERERIAFVAGSYWDIKALLEHTNQQFSAGLHSIDGERLATGRDFDENTGRIAEGKEVLLLEEPRARAIAAALDGQAMKVASVDTRESIRKPYPPFTTSTLQQEANRKLGFGARQTMSVAQRLYENGYITYMRTDSVNLSDQAITAARGRISGQYGDSYLSPSPRQFSTAAKGAQEAHEAIRPSGTEMPTVSELGLSGPEARLYELIWKRTIATQMANARLEFTAVKLNATGPDGETLEFRASGRRVVFPGFLRAYVEGSDDPESALDDRDAPLPIMATGDDARANQISAEGHETKPPARYTEASLVKALEAQGIGRPSTYASIIDTIQARGYVFAKGKQLVPTFTAMAVTRLLEQTHANVVDVDFTAAMERNLDGIADGDESREYLNKFYENDLLAGVKAGEALEARGVCTLSFRKLAPHDVRVGRYGPYVEFEKAEGEEKARTISLPDELAPADLTPELLAELEEAAAAAERPIATDAESGLPIYLRTGRFGPYLQLGEQGEDGKKPRRVSVPKNWLGDQLTQERIEGLLSLPRLIGKHPEDDKVVKAGIGQYGPYVLHNRVYASIKKDSDDDVLTIGMERALQLLAEKAKRGPAREPIKALGEHPKDGGPVEIFDGRYGPYVKHKRVNATIPKGTDPASVTMEQAVEWIAEKAAKPKRPRRRRRS